MVYSFQKLNFLFIIYYFKRDRFLHYIHDCTWSRCIVCLTATTETKGAGIEKVKISSNPDNFITKIFFVI